MENKIYEIEYILINKTNDKFKNLLKNVKDVFSSYFDEPSEFEYSSSIDIDENKINLKDLNISFNYSFYSLKKEKNSVYNFKIYCEEDNKKHTIPKTNDFLNKDGDNEENNSDFYLTTKEIYFSFINHLEKIWHEIFDYEAFKIWDSYSSNIAKDIYPKINSLENNMRRLITKVMFSSAQEDWYEKTIPTKIKKENKDEENKDNEKILYSYTMGELRLYISENYERCNSLEKNEIIENIILKKSEKDIENLEKLISKSNWDLYLSKLFDTGKEHFIQLWDAAKKLRNIVAHNKYMDYLIINEENEIDVLDEKIKRALDIFDNRKDILTFLEDYNELEKKLEKIRVKLKKKRIDKNFFTSIGSYDTYKTIEKYQKEIFKSKNNIKDIKLEDKVFTELEEINKSIIRI